MKGKRIDWRKYPELEDPFNQFIRNLQWKIAYTPAEWEAKREKWDTIQTILSGHWSIICLRSNNAFFDLNKL